MYVTILSPEKTLYAGEAKLVNVPGQKGRFEVLDHHAPIISGLDEGRVVCMGEEPLELDIKSGFIEVVDNRVTLCVEPL